MHVLFNSCYEEIQIWLKIVGSSSSSFLAIITDFKSYFFLHVQRRFEVDFDSQGIPWSRQNSSNTYIMHQHQLCSRAYFSICACTKASVKVKVAICDDQSACHWVMYLIWRSASCKKRLISFMTPNVITETKYHKFASVAQCVARRHEPV